MTSLSPNIQTNTPPKTPPLLRLWYWCKGDFETLRSKLLFFLGLQTALGFLILTVAAYFFMDWHLSKHQEEMLEQRYQVVNRLLNAPQTQENKAVFLEKVDAFFYAQKDMGIEIRLLNNMVFYASQEGPPPPSARFKQFDMSMNGTLGYYFKIKLWYDSKPDQLLLQRVTLSMIAISIFGTLMVLLLCAFILRQTITPLDVVRKQVQQQVQQGGLAPLPIIGPKEMHPLLHAFNQLLAKVEQDQHRLQQFNADLAHEMFSPLSTLKTSIEVTLLNPHQHSKAEYDELLAQNLGQIDHLTSIVRDMLFLSKAESKQLTFSPNKTELAPLCTTVFELYEAALCDANLTIELDTPADAQLVAPVEAGLFQRALSNLISNAIRFAPAESTITVSLRVQGDFVQVCVQNRSQKPIPEESLLRLFDRFYQVQHDRTSTQHRHFGLGLSIVHAISKLHAGDVFAQSTVEYTTIGFSLRLD